MSWNWIGMAAAAILMLMSSPESILQSVFGLQRFRPQQREIIEDVLAGHDVVCVMPTGAGKSLCFQLPAVMVRGLIIVVSPLISLMADQVAHQHEERRGSLIQTPAEFVRDRSSGRPRRTRG